MAKRGRPSKVKLIQPTLPDWDEPPFSFDPEAILYIAALWYNVETTIKELAVAKAKEKKCIPKSVVAAAVKELGLGKWYKEMPDKSEGETND